MTTMCRSRHAKRKFCANPALGLERRGIAKSLEISVETVKEHVQNIMRKIVVKDRTQAAVWAVRKGLV